MLSSGMNYYHLELILSSGTTFHLEVMLSSGNTLYINDILILGSTKEVGRIMRFENCMTKMIEHYFLRLFLRLKKVMFSFTTMEIKI
jgi:hypothetical protein